MIDNFTLQSFDNDVKRENIVKNIDNNSVIETHALRPLAMKYVMSLNNFCYKTR